jgi:hypothetical protein
MNRFKWIVLVLTLGLIAGTAGVLIRSKTYQRLGEPGVRHKPLPNGVVVEMDLPARVGEFDSTNMPQAQVVLGYLPKDTSFAQRYYFAPDAFWVIANVILMGADRSSIHKPDYCLPGQGWRIEKRAVENIPIRDGAAQYKLPVSKWTLRNSIKKSEGGQVEVGGLYVFWFVTKGDQTPIYFNYMRNLAWHLLSTGELQRWAYVSYFTYFPPGQEDAAFERIKNLIATSVPEFQLPPKSSAGAVARQ